MQSIQTMLLLIVVGLCLRIQMMSAVYPIYMATIVLHQKEEIMY